VGRKFGAPRQTAEEKRLKSAQWKIRKKIDGYKLVQVYLSRETMQRIEALHPIFGTSKKMPRLIKLAVDRLYESEIES
jgi:hypothetical protein